MYRERRDETEVVFVTIQAIHEIAGEAYLYQGVLEEWHFDDDGRLDRVILTDAARRPLAKDSPPELCEPDISTDSDDYLEDPRYVNIETDYCIFRVDELSPIIHDPATAAHQRRDPFISLLDDALHRLWGSISASHR